MKRAGHLYEKLVSDENLGRALLEVNQTHRWLPRHRPNRTVAWVERDPKARIADLRRIVNGLIAGTLDLKEPLKKRRYDKSAGKWRDIREPLLWPDQYVHHALVQVLEPVMMRGMDRYCCGSIRGRGIHYGVRTVKRWLRDDPKGTKYCLQMDIRHFYDSIQPETVLARLRRLVKDRRVLGLAERVLEHGVLIGVYCSQWFANTILQPLDRFIHQSEWRVSHYLRYMDNFTLFGPNKRRLRKLRTAVSGRLSGLGLMLKGDWQLYPTRDRPTTALGYRFGHGFTILRKRNLFRLKRALARYRRQIRKRHPVSRKLAAGLLSRLGQLKHCNHKELYKRLHIRGVQKKLKAIVRKYAKEGFAWSMYSVQTPRVARS